MQTDNTLELDLHTTDADRINLRGVPAHLWLEVRMEALRQRLPRVGLLVERYLREGLARDTRGAGE